MTQRLPIERTGFPYLQGVYLPQQPDSQDLVFPFDLPFVRGLDLVLDQSVTFFVGENGSGKSTLLEAIAELAGYNISGGGRNDCYDHRQADSKLAKSLRPKFRSKPRDGFFFRAETFSNFASVLDDRRQDEDFNGNPYQAYGGSSLQTKSHGEAFFSVFKNRVQDGLFLLDEPEAALSPARQLALLALMYDRTREGRTQFIIATHSPILLTFPGATIVDFDGEGLHSISLHDTKHYQITRGILENPEEYWRHLRDDSNNFADPAHDKD